MTKLILAGIFFAFVGYRFRELGYDISYLLFNIGALNLLIVGTVVGAVTMNILQSKRNLVSEVLLNTQ